MWSIFGSSSSSTPKKKSTPEKGKEGKHPAKEKETKREQAAPAHTPPLKPLDQTTQQYQQAMSSSIRQQAEVERSNAAKKWRQQAQELEAALVVVKQKEQQDFARIEKETEEKLSCLHKFVQELARLGAATPANASSSIQIPSPASSSSDNDEQQRFPELDAWIATQAKCLINFVQKQNYNQLFSGLKTIRMQAQKPLRKIPIIIWTSLPEDFVKKHWNLLQDFSPLR